MLVDPVWSGSPVCARPSELLTSVSGSPPAGTAAEAAVVDADAGSQVLFFSLAGLACGSFRLTWASGLCLLHGSSPNPDCRTFLVEKRYRLPGPRLREVDRPTRSSSWSMFWV